MRILMCTGWMLFLSLSLLGQRFSEPKLKCGTWTGKLSLNSTTKLPFEFTIANNPKDKRHYTYTISNAKERIELIPRTTIGDSLLLEFPSFGTYLVVKLSGKRSMSGYWVNPNKGANYRIPCTLTSGYGKRFDNNKLYVSNVNPSNYAGRWETTFEPGTTDAYKAVGLFEQNFNDITGTFLTETGDYRFLDGNVAGDSLYLSCFDGSHAFLFTGKMTYDKINGSFYSGKHWQTTWEAVRNEDFELTHPDSLTYLVNDTPIHFRLRDIQGNEFIFPNEQYRNRVTIIQIMGTWCPNCMDETRYFKELYKKYHSQGLEIISVCYESGTDSLTHINRINTLKERLGLDYTFLIGGTANKGLASQHFSMLNQIISFPTAIFIGRDGKVKKVHTGFNGPGTGTYYEQFTRETEDFLESLLKQ